MRYSGGFLIKTCEEEYLKKKDIIQSLEEDMLKLKVYLSQMSTIHNKKTELITMINSLEPYQESIRLTRDNLGNAKICTKYIQPPLNYLSFASLLNDYIQKMIVIRTVYEEKEVPRKNTGVRGSNVASGTMSVAGEILKGIASFRGGSKCYVCLKGSNTGNVRKYLVHTNEKKEKYIKDNGKQILLSSIRGKYNYVKD